MESPRLRWKVRDGAAKRHNVPLKKKMDVEVCGKNNSLAVLSKWTE